FAASGPLGTARYRNSLTLLPNGKVLAAGGNTTGGATTATAELFDEGQGYPDYLRPNLTSVAGAATPSATITITGSNLGGVGECASGGCASSARNYPLVRLMREGSDQIVYARTRDTSGAWASSSSTLQAILPASVPAGAWRLQVVTNAIPSFDVPLLNCDDGN